MEDHFGMAVNLFSPRFLFRVLRCNCCGSCSTGNCCCCALLILAVSVSFPRKLKQLQALPTAMAAGYWILIGAAHRIRLHCKPSIEEYPYYLTKLQKRAKTPLLNSCSGIWSFFTFVLKIANFISPLRSSCQGPVSSSHTCGRCSDHCLIPL